MKKFEEEIINNEELIEVEELSQEDMDDVTGGSSKCLGTKYKTITLSSVGQSKTVWSMKSVVSATHISASPLVNASYWGGRAGIKFVRKSSKKGKYVLKYRETLIASGNYYNIVLTVKCT